MLILVCSFVEKLKVGTFVVPHEYATNINVFEKECHKSVVKGGGGGHRWRICAKHNYKMWCSIIGQISLRLWVDFQFHFLSRFFD